MIPACALPDQACDRLRRRLFPLGSAATFGSTHANGEIIASFDGYSDGLGTFSAGIVNRAQELRISLPLSSFASNRRSIDKEMI